MTSSGRSEQIVEAFVATAGTIGITLMLDWQIAVVTSVFAILAFICGVCIFNHNSVDGTQDSEVSAKAKAFIVDRLSNKQHLFSCVALR